MVVNIVVKFVTIVAVRSCIHGCAETGTAIGANK